MSRLDADQWQPHPTQGFVPPQGVEPHTHDAAAVVNAGLPVGMLAPYVGAAAPTGWLICDGSSFSSSAYPALASLLGGTTLPNLKGKVIAGYDASQTEFNTLKGTGGSKTLTIASANLPVHTHAIDHDHAAVTSAGGSSHDHGLTNHNHSGGTGIHAHNVTGEVGTNNTAHGHGAAAGQVSAVPNVGGFFTGVDGATNNAGVANAPQGSADTAHNHSVDLPSLAGSSGNGAFANTALPSLTPYMTLNYIIKAA